MIDNFKKILLTSFSILLVAGNSYAEDRNYPLVIEKNNSVEICSNEKSCKNIELPKSIEKVQYVFNGNFVSKAKSSWLLFPKKGNIHLCALPYEGNKAKCVNLSEPTFEGLGISYNISSGVKTLSVFPLRHDPLFSDVLKKRDPYINKKLNIAIDYLEKNISGTKLAKSSDAFSTMSGSCGNEIQCDPIGGGSDDPPIVIIGPPEPDPAPEPDPTPEPDPIVIIGPPEPDPIAMPAEPPTLPPGTAPIDYQRAIKLAACMALAYRTWELEEKYCVTQFSRPTPTASQYRKYLECHEFYMNEYNQRRDDCNAQYGD